MNAIKQYAGLPKQVYLLCVVRVITCMGMFIYPFLALLLKTRLRFDELQIGQVMLLIAGANISGSLISGKLADRLGRKRVYLTALIVGVVSLIGGGLVCERLAVIPFVVVVYFCVSMTMPATAAMVTDWSDEGNRPECFSLMYLCTNIGFAVGPLLAGLLYYNHTPWIFWGQAVSFSAAALLACFWIHDSCPGISEEGVRQTGARLEGVRPKGARQSGTAFGRTGREDNLFLLVLQSPVLTCFVICLAVLSLCYIQIDFLLPLQVENIFGEELGSRFFGYISAANGIVCVVATPVLVSLTKRGNQLRNIAFAGLLYVVGFGCYAAVKSLPAFLLLVVVWTSGEILISTGSGVFIAEHSPETHRARFQSLYELARGAGKAVGPTAFGYYLTARTIESAWVLVGIICLLTSGVLFLLYLRDRKITVRR